LWTFPDVAHLLEWKNIPLTPFKGGIHVITVRLHNSPLRGGQGGVKHLSTNFTEEPTNFLYFSLTFYQREKSYSDLNGFNSFLRRRNHSMAKREHPNTLAVRFLKTKHINFVPYLYRYEEHGGTRHAADMLNVPEHSVIKTLVLETDLHRPFLVLMHGDCKVSTKQLAHCLGVKRVVPCDATSAHKYTGYRVGGISPLGTRTPLPVYVEATILELDRIYINGGKRGFLVEIDPCDLQKALQIEKVEVAI